MFRAYGRAAKCRSSSHAGEECRGAVTWADTTDQQRMHSPPHSGEAVSMGRCQPPPVLEKSPARDSCETTASPEE